MSFINQKTQKRRPSRSLQFTHSVSLLPFSSWRKGEKASVFITPINSILLVFYTIEETFQLDQFLISHPIYSALPAGEKVKKQVSSFSPSLSAQFYQLTRKPGVEEVKIIDLKSVSERHIKIIPSCSAGRTAQPSCRNRPREKVNC